MQHLYSYVFKLFCILILFSGFLALPQASAQTELQRVSAVERSDGLGYVVRFHLSETIDSSKVLQPSTDLLQVKLYSENLDTVNFNPPVTGNVFKDFILYELPSGIAFDIKLHEGHYFNFSAYNDQNGRDLLLALAQSAPEDLTALSDDQSPIDWNLFTHDAQTETSEEFLFDEPADERRNGSRFEVVVIDAGHGGWEPGAGGVNGVHEKDVTLAVALKVGEYIEQNIPDLKVVYTRTEDEYVSLVDRGKIANENNGDLFVSIHANSFSHANKARQRSVHGAEVYFLGMARSQSALEVMKRENSVVQYETGEIEELTEEDLLIYELMNAGNMSTSQRIAEKMEYQFRERAQRRSRGVKQAGFQVLYEASMPGVLIELGFISNPAEANYLNSEYGQAIVASAIFRSIRDFKIEYDRSYNRQTSAR
ncbi:N-acetylmuramoyl-L-alanine amidase [Rhodohalobacter sp. SW132]|uniref:N-acetylmuramoyl-L-alanine amidase family protein n=1 Tax=Rhodohalobacter sp. SW132 TaxID=2293433 RepID=UPI000E2727CA|nr:N-acetylmuramoyl-L-alanine amidase [Rhodohalobacter sp. SW132]REL24038.1 N-acetylmuramoyl-L-alanine amidase [Rhodohalobacter sp. SW132]